VVRTIVPVTEQRPDMFFLADGRAGLRSLRRERQIQEVQDASLVCAEAPSVHFSWRNSARGPARVISLMTECV